MGDPTLAPAGDSSFVPWTPEILRPLFSKLVPIVEAKDIEDLRGDALKISTAAAALVERKAPWGTESKEMLIFSGGETAAKWLNRFGVSSEWCPELTLATVVSAIWTQRTALKTELRQMAAELKAAAKPQTT